MATWSDPADLSTATRAYHVRLTNIDTQYQLLTYVRASEHFAQLISVANDTATVVGAPKLIHTPPVGHTLVVKSGPEDMPALKVTLGPTGSNTIIYAFVEEDTSNTYTYAYLLDVTTLDVIDYDVATLVMTGTSPAVDYLSGNTLLFVIGQTSNTYFATCKVLSTSVTFTRQGILDGWQCNTDIPISFVKSDYRTGLLYMSWTSYPPGYTLANTEAFIVDCTDDAVVNGTANPIVTEFDGQAAALRVLPGTYPVYNGYEPITVIDSTLTPLQYTPFAAGIDALICTNGPASVTHSLPTWDELNFGSPRLFVNSADNQVDALALLTPDGTTQTLWTLITDVMVAPLQVPLPIDSRFEGFGETTSSINEIATVKVGAFYIVAMSYTNGAANKFVLTAYKDDASVYGYVQDNQLRVIQRPLPSPAVLYPTTVIQSSQIGGGTSTKVPNYPTGLNATSATYEDSLGRIWAKETFAWNAVTQNTDGTDFTDFAYYSVYYRVNEPGSAYQFAGNSLTTGLVVQGFSPGSDFLFTVYAVSKSNVTSSPAPEVLFTTAGDSTPPPTPSTPTVTSRLGTVRCDWDGFGSLGETMPADFAYTEVHASTTSGFTPSSSTLIDKIPAPGYAILTNATYAATYYFKLVSYDTSGNASAASAQAYAVVQKVEGPDLAANSVTANSIAAGAIDGQVITGAIVQTAKPLSQGGQNARIMLDTTRLIAYNTSGDATFTLDASTGALSVDGSITSGSSITGFSIIGGNITIGTGSSIFKADSSGIYLGASDFASAPFRVSPAGVLTATSGTFSGSITGATGTFSGSIAIGSGNSIFKADSNGIYLGNSTFASAPFRVTPAGALTADSISIGGANGINYTGSGAVTIGTNVTITGSVTASAVAIGTDYWNASGAFRLGGANGITYSGSGSVTVGTSVSILGSIYIGTDYWTSAGAFQLGGTNGIKYTGTGSVTIGTNVTITGSITASAVAIGSDYWNSSGYFQLGGTNGIKYTSTGLFVGGWTVNSTFLQGGSPGAYSYLYAVPQSGQSINVSGHIYSSGGEVYGSTGLWSGGYVYAGAIATSTGAYNIVQDINGYLRYTALSSRRWKNNIVDIETIPELDPELLLQIPVRAFKYDDWYLQEDDSRYDTFIPGMIAEEVDAIYPIATEYDKEGLVAVWSPQYLLPGMLRLIQKMDARIKMLESAIS